MKNFVWISPHFPETYYHFVESLKRNGFNVLGIGDAPYSELSQYLINGLTEYYFCENMTSIENEINAVKYFENKYGHIDYLESNNEFWLSSDAILRERFNIKTGLLPNDLLLLQRKSSMKKLYEKANVKTAPYIIISDLEHAIEFCKNVGYPVFIKPDVGVGSGETYKIQNIDELQSFFVQKSPEIVYICEPMLSGTIVSFDGICDSNSNVIFSTSNVFPPSVSDVKNQQLDFFYYTLPNVPDDLLKIGISVVKSFGLRNRFFHCEFFRLDKDIACVGKQNDLVGLEVNVRTPGGYTPDLINYANSVDCYQIFADSLAFDSSSYDRNATKFYAACASRRNNFEYFYSDEEVLKTFNANIVQSGSYPFVFSDIMGDRYFMAKFENQNDVEIFKKYVQKRNPQHIEKPSRNSKNFSELLNICDTHIDGA